MKVKRINENLLEAIKYKFPKETNLAKMLMDTLCLGKEAIYRRLRGEVPLTLNEAALLSKRFRISIDHLIQSETTANLILELKPQRYHNLQEGDFYMLREFLETIKVIHQDENSEFVISSNVFPQFPSHAYYQLAKYSSFRWMYLNESIDKISKFHELDFSEELFSLEKEIIQETMQISNTCYIWDDTIFEGIVKEIKYFSGIYLINQQDVLLLKKELHEFLDFFEKVTVNGQYENGNKVQVYISSINSDAGYCYLKNSDIYISMIGVFALNYMTALDEKSLEKIKERIHFMKRVSTLISGSSEIQRINFFKKQREIIDTL